MYVSKSLKLYLFKNTGFQTKFNSVKCFSVRIILFPPESLILYIYKTKNTRTKVKENYCAFLTFNPLLLSSK